MIPSP
jgi:hypothetical protein